jgi:GT2 family glycosyltransferase
VDASVVITTLNGAKTIGDQLDALTKQDFDGEWEVIVVDNGSTDSTRDVVGRYRGRLPGLRVLDAHARRNRAYALNTGAAAASGETLLFCDDDDLVAGDWVTRLHRALDDDVLAVSRLEVALLNEPWVQSTRRPAHSEERLPYPPYLPHGAGTGMGMRRSTFDELGGFDESFVIVQDTEFCVRAQLAGKRLVYVDDAVVQIRYRTNLGDIFRQAKRYAEDNARLHARYSTGLLSTRGWWKWPFRHWATIGGAALRAHDPRARARLAWVAGWQVGRLIGTVRYRVPAT